MIYNANKCFINKKKMDKKRYTKERILVQIYHKGNKVSIYIQNIKLLHYNK
jgi:hypothetical protein